MKKYKAGFFSTSKKKHVYNGIEFKSGTEKDSYQLLINKGYNPEYEPITYEMVPLTIISVPYYKNTNKNSTTKRSNAKIQPIRYTPDFIFKHKKYTVILECKGYDTKDFEIRFKLFRRWLEQQPDKDKYIIAKIYTIKQLEEFLEYLRYY